MIKTKFLSLRVHVLLGGGAGETTTSLGWLVVSLSCPVNTSPSSGMKPPWGRDPASS